MKPHFSVSIFQLQILALAGFASLVGCQQKIERSGAPGKPFTKLNVQSVPESVTEGVAVESVNACSLVQQLPPADKTAVNDPQQTFQLFRYSEVTPQGQLKGTLTPGRHLGLLYALSGEFQHPEKNPRQEPPPSLLSRPENSDVKAAAKKGMADEWYGFAAGGAVWAAFTWEQLWGDLNKFIGGKVIEKVEGNLPGVFTAKPADLLASKLFDDFVRLERRNQFIKFLETEKARLFAQTAASERDRAFTKFVVENWKTLNEEFLRSNGAITFGTREREAIRRSARPYRLWSSPSWNARYQELVQTLKAIDAPAATNKGESLCRLVLAQRLTAQLLSLKGIYAAPGIDPVTGRFQAEYYDDFSPTEYPTSNIPGALLNIGNSRDKGNIITTDWLTSQLRFDHPRVILRGTESTEELIYSVRFFVKLLSNRSEQRWKEALKPALMSLSAGLYGLQMKNLKVRDLTVGAGNRITLREDTTENIAALANLMWERYAAFRPLSGGLKSFEKETLGESTPKVLAEGVSEQFAGAYLEIKARTSTATSRESVQLLKETARKLDLYRKAAVLQP